MQVSKWGDDLAVRLPSDVVDGLNLKEGDEVEVRVTRAPHRRAVSDEKYGQLWERVKAIQRPLPTDYRFSREEANGIDRLL